MIKGPPYYVTALATAFVLIAATLAVQGGGSGSGPGSGAGADDGMGPSMMMGRSGMGQAVMSGCPMMGRMSGGMMGGMMGGGSTFAEGRIAFLKAELGITEAQTAAWSSFAEAVRKNLQNMQDMHKSMMKAMGAATPIERLDEHITAMEGRLTALKDLKAPLTAFYSALDETQKKKADELLTAMGCMM